MASSSSVQRAQIGPVCPFCKQTKVTNWICIDCDKFLCNECKKVHLQVKTTCKHEIVNWKANRRAESGESPKIYQQKLKSVKCRVHHKYYYSNYCVHCDTLVCPQCLATSHEKHSVEVIEKIHRQRVQMLERCQNEVEEDLIPLISEKIDKLKFTKKCYEEKFKTEKDKIEEQGKILKQKISEKTDKLVKQLQEGINKNIGTILGEIKKLETIQTELIETVTQLKESKIKDDMEAINVDVKNLSRCIKDCDTSMELPQETMKFCPGDLNEERLTDQLGSLQTCHLAGDVEFKVVKSYTVGSNIGRGLAVDKSGTIWVGAGDGVIKVKPDKEPKKIMGVSNIVDIAVIKSGELIIASKDDPVIRIKRSANDIKTFYTIPRSNICILALHTCKDGKILILFMEKFNPLWNLISVIRNELYIVALSKDGKQLRISKCGEERIWLKWFRYKITENIGGDICIHESLGYEYRIIHVDHKERDKGYQYSIYFKDIATTMLGNVVMTESDSVIIWNHEGDIIKRVKMETLGLNCCSSLCFKNNKELLVISDDKIYVLELSTVI